eukprot:66682_1
MAESLNIAIEVNSLGTQHVYIFIVTYTKYQQLLKNHMIINWIKYLMKEKRFIANQMDQGEYYGNMTHSTKSSPNSSYYIYCTIYSSIEESWQKEEVQLRLDYFKLYQTTAMVGHHITRDMRIQELLIQTLLVMYERKVLWLLHG